MFDQRFERSQKTRLTLRLTLAPSTRTPDATTDFIVSGFQFGNPAIDCAPRNPSRHGNRRHAAAAERDCLIGRKQPAPPLVQERRHPLKPTAQNVDLQQKTQKIFKASKHLTKS